MGTAPATDPAAPPRAPLPSRGARHLVPALLLLTGGVVYGALVGRELVTFLATPLIIGGAALVAGVVGRSRHLIPCALVLLGWGGAVLTAEYLLPSGRQASAYMLGIGVATLVARLLSRPEERSSWFTAAAVTATVAGAAFSLTEQLAWLGGWKTWVATTLAWAVVEALRPVRQQAATAASPAEEAG